MSDLTPPRVLITAQTKPTATKTHCSLHLYSHHKILRYAQTFWFGWEFGWRFGYNISDPDLTKLPDTLSFHAFGLTSVGYCEDRTISNHWHTAASDDISLWLLQ